MPSSRILTTLLVLLPSIAGASLTPVIDGLGDDLARQIIERTPADTLRCDSPRWALRAWGRDLEDNVRRALRARSYYGPTIQLRMTREADCWEVRLEVERGEQTRLRSLDVRIEGEGSTDPAFAAARDALAPTIDRPFREEAHEALKRGLRRVALERGYFDFRFTTARVDVWAEEQAADVEIEVDTGARYRFGTTRFDVEPDALDEAMLERFRLWQAGAPYLTMDVERLRRRLLQAGYFETVNVMPRTDARRDGEIDLEVELGMRARHEVGGGVGFVTDFGPRIRANYENRYLNRRGHQGNLRSNLSPVLQELNMDYRMPLERGDDAWLVTDLTLQREKTDTAETLTQALSVRRVRGGPWNSRLTESLTLQREDFDVASDDDVAILLMPGLGISKSRQIRARPLEIGWRLDGEIRGAAEPTSSATFLQLYGRGAVAFPLGERARLLGRLEVGTTLADSLAKLPTYIRFFAGGDRSIRGYSLDSLGPTDDEGEVRGGRYLAVGSLELEHSVAEHWSVAVFVDSGGAFNSTSDPLATGVGIGARWMSPVGAIRFDLASPLDDDSRSIRVHIGVGSTFQ